MRRIGVIGLGDMGSGLAKNLLAAGFDVVGYDRNPPKCAALEKLGGRAVASAAAVGDGAETVFVIVMNGAQAEAVTLGDGLITTMKPGSTVILCATIRAAEAREIAAGLAEAGIDLIDCPITGGYTGAQNGTLTLMAAGSDAAMDRCRAPMEAISAHIYRVGTEAGQGQTVKACLQTIIGAAISATCEAAALAAKAGVDGALFQQIVSTSAAGSTVTSEGLSHIIDRRFAGTGSHIDTLLKDLRISTDMARELGVPLTLAPAALALMAEAQARFPDGDNWVAARITEEAAGAELHRTRGSA